MLIRQIFSGPDFKRSLKQQRLAGFAMLLVGLVGIGCHFFLLPGSGLPDFVRGFYTGAASGICLGAAFLLVRTTYLLTHPEAMQKAKVQAQDEREKAIVSEAFRIAGLVTFFGSAAALFVVLPLSRAAFFTLLGAMAVYAVTFLTADLMLERRM